MLEPHLPIGGISIVLPEEFGGVSGDPPGGKTGGADLYIRAGNLSARPTDLFSRPDSGAVGPRKPAGELDPESGPIDFRPGAIERLLRGLRHNHQSGNQG